MQSMNKSEILDNVESYSADELVEFIRKGIVTFEELCEETEGHFPAKVRKEVQEKLNGSEEEDWKNAQNSNDIKLLEQYLETYPNGSHREDARKLKAELQKRQDDKQTDDEWQNVNKNSIAALKEFCQNNPSSSHCKEAKRLINVLGKEEFVGFDTQSLTKRIKRISTDNNLVNPREEIFKVVTDSLDKDKISCKDLLSMIQGDNNILGSWVVNSLLEKGYIDYADLTSIGIDRRFITHLIEGSSRHGFLIPEKLEKINKLSTEVYFWGIPSSGKSCALGAILSVAKSGVVAKSMTMDNDCQGYGYMTRLSSIFQSNGEVCTLPDSTSIYATYEMGFDLADTNDRTHPLTCIDLAGELMRCMYKSDAGEYIGEDEVEALDTLTRILIDNRTKNRKIHFFVLEYGAEDREYEGLKQDAYLDGALRYIERTGIFKSDTDAIYLMITKVDKAKANGKQLEEILRKYISDTYQGFYNGLKRICRKYEINNGEVEIIPFSLGKVCFQDYCLVDNKSAKGVVSKILQRSKGFQEGKGAKFLKKFKK